MKLNRLETHDRLLHFKKDQALNISQGAEDCLKKNELSLCLQQYSPYIYLFAHPRTSDDGVTKRMIWQPRLTRPTPQTNSYLFRAKSRTDIIEVCWLIPPREQWKQYNKGNVTEDATVRWSIDMFTNHREHLSKPLEDDLSDEIGSKIYQRVFNEITEQRKMDRMSNLIKIGEIDV